MYVIPRRLYEKYNSETCFQAEFTEQGLNFLKNKYRNVRGLPAFIHNLMKGRPTLARELFLEKPDIFLWTHDRSAITIPNICDNISGLKNNPRILKDDPTEGLALVSWAIDPRLLKKYGWQSDTEDNLIDSFQNFLRIQDQSQNLPSDYSFFRRTNSQETIADIESADNKTPYLASILNLSSTHLPFLQNLKESNLQHLTNHYGINLKKDIVEMYFHFPYHDSTTTLHLHIRVNQGRHPMERIRSFTLEDIINCLTKGNSINSLVLQRKTHYCDNIDILQNIEGILINEVPNPFLLTSPFVDEHSKPFKLSSSKNVGGFPTTLEFLQEYRHEHPRLQYEYDKQFGLSLRS